MHQSFFLQFLQNLLALNEIGDKTAKLDERNYKLQLRLVLGE